ncbi:MAG: hypothetical protein R2850_10830 [Bacteroidia bacterium]
MKICLRLLSIAFFTLFIFYGCGERKQRDVRKLNWYEISTDARNNTVRVLLPIEELEYWNEKLNRDEDSAKSRISLNVFCTGLELQPLRDSLEMGTSASLVLLRGAELELALNRAWLYGPFDRLLPVSKTINTASHEFSVSEGINSRGYAVPLVSKDSLPPAFFGIPAEASAKAAALFVLEKALEVDKLGM